MCNHLKPLNKNNLNAKALHASKNKQHRKLIQHIYNSKKWKQLRNSYITQHPICEYCGKPATTVHHIKRFSIATNKREMEQIAYDEHNLMSLCVKCHLSQHRK